MDKAISLASGRTTSTTLRYGRVAAIALVAATVLGVLLAGISVATACLPPNQNYVVTTSSGTPASGNWADASGALWSPPGGYPGQCTNGDSAADTNGSPTTISVTTTVPGSIGTLNLSCAGCVIDVQSGGQLTLAGSSTIGSGSTLKVSGGSLILASGASLNFLAGSAFQFTGGSVDVQAGSQMTVPTSTVSGGTLQVSGGTLTIPAATTLSLQSGSQLTLTGGGINGGGTISNAGSLQMNGSSTVAVAAVLNNNSPTGSVTVNSGTLSLTGGGTGDAPFTLNGGTLNFPSTSYTLTTNGVVSGPGTLSITGATLSIGGVTSPGGFTMTGGTLTGPGFLTVTSTMQWDGGTITCTPGSCGGTQLAGTGTGNFTGTNGTLLVNGRAFDDYGVVVYSAKTNPLQLTNGAAFTVYGSFQITNDGNVTGDVNSAFDISPNGILSKNNTSGTSTFSVTTNNDYQVEVFNGTLAFTGGGTHNGQFFAIFPATTLQFSGSHTLTGSSFLGGSGNVTVTSGLTIVNGTYAVDGLTTLPTGASLDVVNGGYTHDLTLSGGTLTTDGGFALQNIGTWSGGTIDVTCCGPFDVLGTATLTITASVSAAVLQGTELANEGTIIYNSTTNPLELQNAAFITNNGLFDIQSNVNIIVTAVLIGDNRLVTKAAKAAAAAKQPRRPIKRDGASTATLFNNGTLQKTAAGGTTVFQPELDNTGGTVKLLNGTLSVSGGYLQSSGTTTLGPGSLTVTGIPLALSGGVIDGQGTITGDLDNSNGTVSPGGAGVGTITLAGNYTQGGSIVVAGQRRRLVGLATSPGGTLAIGLASASSYDVFAVTGSATLNGVLNVSLLSGYQPANGVTFQPMTYASVSGDFATKNLPTWSPHGSMLESTNPNFVLLTAVVGPTQSDLAAGMTGPANINAGALLSYTLTISNGGPDPSTGTTTVVDTLPAGATGASGSGTGWLCGAVSGGTITCTSSAAIANAASFPTLTFSMTAPPNGGSVSNSATVSNANDPNGANNTASVATTVVAQADLSITKTGPAGVTAGQNVVYTIVVTNNGPSSSAGVTVTDVTPANLTFVSNSGGCTSAFPCNLGTLTSGQSVSITSTYSTSPSFSGNVTNTATVSSSGTPDPNNANNSANATTNVGAQADLSVTKTGPASTNTGQNVTYTIVVTNGGPSPAANTVVSDATPVGLAFQSNSGACTSAYPCNVGTLAAGQSITIMSTYTVPGNYSGAQINNTASVTSTVNDPTPGNNSSTATTNVAQAADVTLTKSGPTSASAGQNVTYTVIVTNAGPSAAAAVVVNDPTPAGVTFVSNNGGCTTAYPCNLGNLASGAQVTISSTYNIPPTFSGSSFTNTATASSGANDPNLSNNSSSVTTNVITGSSDVSISKSGPPSVSVGQNITYTIIVSNAGPLNATGVVVSDTTPAGLTFVSNSGACTSAFPCNLGTLNAGTSVTISSTFNIPANYFGSSVSNTATVGSSSSDGNLANNSSTATTNLTTAGGADLAVAKSGPQTAMTNQLIDFEIDVVNNGPGTATNVNVADPAPAGLQFVSSSGACPSGFPCTIASMGPGTVKTIGARYRVTATAGTTVTNSVTVSAAATDSNPSNNTAQASVLVTAPIGCATAGPTLIAPANNSSTTSPVFLSWSAVEGAASYTVAISGSSPSTFTTNLTTATVTLPNGAYTWTVRVNFSTPCLPLTSSVGHFSICNPPLPPVASVVGTLTTGQTYNVTWTLVDGASAYELQESTDIAFSNPTLFTLTAVSKSFTKTAGAPTPYFYRVRATTACAPSEYSPVISVVVIPVPLPKDPRLNVTVPSGSTTPVTFQVFIPGLPGGPTSFAASTDRPWATVVPQAGIVPPEGTLLTISLDPSSLTNGTWTGTILVVYSSPGTTSAKIEPNGSTTTSTPVSINLVTPITPGKLPTPSASTLIIPTVGHLAGVDSQWQSDVRIANLTSSKQNYLVSFTTGSGDTSIPVKQTTLSIDPGATVALDDLVRSWFGVGSMGDSTNGVLFVQAVDASGRIIPNFIPNDISVNKTLAISSRTYNTASKSSSSAGTLGQFVPATAFANFIGHAGTNVPTLLSLQQIAQSDAYRTNLGLVEASGKPVSLSVSAFDAAGNKLLQLPISLAGGQQQQLNSFLVQNNVSLTNGRISVEVTNGDGRVNAYASVVDSATGDPFLVPGTPIGAASSHYIVPAVGDLNTGNASWRSDLRIFNSGAAPQTTTLTFYPNGNPSGSVTKQVSVNPGEVKAVDGLLQSLFGITNASGALHVTTPTEAPLIVTSRTFNQTSNGTLGQFIPAVTVTDAVGSTDRALQILQAEESVHYRTNLGVAEVSGKSATIEISVFLPDSKVIPRVTLQLGANESRQIPILSSLGLGATYNARLAVRVVDGAGKVTAYGSVVDMTTQAPTFIPAQ